MVPLQTTAPSGNYTNTATGAMFEDAWMVLVSWAYSVSRNGSKLRRYFAVTLFLESELRYSNL